MGEDSERPAEGAETGFKRSKGLSARWPVTKRSAGPTAQDLGVSPMIHTLDVLRRQLVLVALVQLGPQSGASLRAWALAMRCVAFRLDAIATNQERFERGK